MLCNQFRKREVKNEWVDRGENKWMAHDDVDEKNGLCEWMSLSSIHFSLSPLFYF